MTAAKAKKRRGLIVSFYFFLDLFLCPSRVCANTLATLLATLSQLWSASHIIDLPAGLLTNIHCHLFSHCSLSRTSCFGPQTALTSSKIWFSSPGL